MIKLSLQKSLEESEVGGVGTPEPEVEGGDCLGVFPKRKSIKSFKLSIESSFLFFMSKYFTK